MRRGHMTDIICGVMDSQQRMAYLMSALPVIESAGKIFDIMTDEKGWSSFKNKDDIFDNPAFFQHCINLAARFDNFEQATKALMGAHRK